MSGFDARKEQRYTFKQQVVIDDKVYAESVDISIGGLLVRTDNELTPNTTVTLTFPTYDISLKAFVKHTVPGVGTGLKFDVENIEQWERISDIIEDLRCATDDCITKPSVIVVDDHERFRLALQRVLQKHGYSVAVAADAMEAIRLMNKFPFHAILVDYDMDKIDGVKLVELLREAPDHKDKPAIVMSAKKDREAVDRARKAGANAFLLKTKNLPLDVLKSLQKHLHVYEQKTGEAPAPGATAGPGA